MVNKQKHPRRGALGLACCSEGFVPAAAQRQNRAYDVILVSRIRGIKPRAQTGWQARMADMPRISPIDRAKVDKLCF